MTLNKVKLFTYGANQLVSSTLTYKLMEYSDKLAKVERAKQFHRKYSSCSHWSKNPWEIYVKNALKSLTIEMDIRSKLPVIRSTGELEEMKMIHKLSGDNLSILNVNKFTSWACTYDKAVAIIDCNLFWDWVMSKNRACPNITVITSYW